MRLKIKLTNKKIYDNIQTLSLIRELIRFQDLLNGLVPLELWQMWTDANEKIIDYLESEK